MKFIIIALFLSFNVFANNCPDIEGSFSCESSEHIDKNLDITKEKIGNILIYNIRSSDGEDLPLITDGVVRTTEDVSFVSTCQNDSITLKIDMSNEDFTISSKRIFKLKNSNELTDSLTINGKTSDGTILRDSKVFNCKRI